MGINEICTGRLPNAQRMPSVPDGMSLPEEASVTEDQIEILNDIGWVFSTLSTLVELDGQVNRILGDYDQDGGLSPQGWAIIGEEAANVAGERFDIRLVSTGAAANAALDRLEAADSPDYPGKAADIVLLQQAVRLEQEAYTGIRGSLQENTHPRAYEIFNAVYVEGQRLKPTLRSIVRRLNVELTTETRNTLVRQMREEQSQEGPANPELINWDTLSEPEIQRAVGAIQQLLTSSCRDYAALIPEAPVETDPQPIPIEPRPPIEPRRIDGGGFISVLGGYDGEVSDSREASLNNVLPATGPDVAAEVMAWIEIGRFHLEGWYSMTGRTANDFSTPRGSRETYGLQGLINIAGGFSLGLQALVPWNAVVTPQATGTGEQQNTYVQMEEEASVGGGLVAEYAPEEGNGNVRVAGGPLFQVRGDGSLVGGYASANTYWSVLSWLGVGGGARYTNLNGESRVDVAARGAIEFPLRDGDAGTIGIDFIFGLNFTSQDNVVNLLGLAGVSYRFGRPRLSGLPGGF